MKKSQSQRLAKVLEQDKSGEPLKLLPSLKSDLRDVLRQYGELDTDISVAINEDDDGYQVMLVANVKRFKNYCV